MQYRKAMNVATPIKPEKSVGHSVCPHDCPSACALDIDLTQEGRIGRVRGASANTYTSGVICAKVARYSERIYHPGRLMVPQRRKGAKGAGGWQEVTWEDALDEIADAFVKAEQQYGSEAVWPYFYAGTMGQVQRDSIERLRHAKRYSGFFGSICTNMAWTGFTMATGALRGPDPREMARADCVVIWGTNAVATQVNVMDHAVRSRKARGTPIVAVDVYMNETMKQADIALLVRPGTDGALACGIMHVLLRDNLADRAYMAKFTDFTPGFEAHLATRTPEWAEAICGVPAAEIEAVARLFGAKPRSFFRLGYGFGRQRNGAVNMHAAACIPAVTGAWQHEGGGAFHSNSGIFKWNKALIEGHDAIDRSIRVLDQSQIGRVLTGDTQALYNGPPVKALLIQNTNPVSVAPEQELVKQGFAREDLFVCVHEQFMTETAAIADIVLPATMFMEHDDVYQAGGSQYILLGPKLVDAPGECRSNHEVICGLARRLGVTHEGFELSPRQIIDWTLQKSGWGDLEKLERERWIDCQPPFEKAHYLDGFKWPDGKFRFTRPRTGGKATCEGTFSVLLGEGSESIAQWLPIVTNNALTAEQRSFDVRLTGLECDRAPTGPGQLKLGTMCLHARFSPR